MTKQRQLTGEQLLVAIAEFPDYLDRRRSSGSVADDETLWNCFIGNTIDAVGSRFSCSELDAMPVASSMVH